MQDAGIDMTKHAITQLMLIEDGAKLHNKVGQIFRRYRRVFDKRHWASFTLGIAKQADRLLAHRPEQLHLLVTAGDGVTDVLASLAGLFLQSLGQIADIAF